MNREENEAYCIAIPEKTYAIYFPKGGNVSIQTNSQVLNFMLINVLDNKWKLESDIPNMKNTVFELTAPDTINHWIAVPLF